MENRFKRRISRIFRTSFGSCRTRNVSDVAKKAVFSLKNHKFRSLKTSSPPPKGRSLPSFCKPRCSYQSTQETLPRRRKVSAKAPPASPIPHLQLFSDCKDFGFYEKKKSSATNKKKKKKKRVHVKRNNTPFNSMFFGSSSHESVHYGGRGRGWWWWFSSEDEAETLFSSRTLSLSSSDSSSEWHQHRDHRRRAKIGNKVKDSFVVVKSSDDPYTDFRASMVEMIVEREIFEAKELKQLLQCFLSLNSHHHHRTIVEAFTEICKTLFSNWS
ncbi:transcription repressor OFP8-like isoform X2 [Hibiscus syriacus]|uniref:transcription repressor OFP8-like isoform X1 n=1 Tax=Hibiscus syriacus TaxID=106335 RepID=UPI0019226709|nr:transcription repressor OFP8-like isoform X1 [Hibiscus syriacus]XP_039052779.1 transcription repressor OFP8-like isoform X2 [Hibiscus syriacus]